MNQEKSPAPDIKPMAVFVDRGAVITQEFVSRDGHILAGYRATPGTAGFPAWARSGDIVNGFREVTYRWFSTEDAARAWTLAQVSGAHQSGLVSDDVTRGVQHAERAA